MSITSAFNSAFSGLTAAGRASDIVAQNLANALNPAYARRSLSVDSGNSQMAGVRVTGVVRHADPALLSVRRTAEAENASAELVSGFYDKMTGLVGTVDDPFSMAARLSDFDSAVLEAASQPDSMPRLSALSVAAEKLTRSISDAAEGLQDTRTAADTSIDVQVGSLNRTLKEVEKLNARITIASAGGMSPASLIDQRSELIDQINEMVPVNVVDRENGKVALFSEGGIILLDGQAAELEFTPVKLAMPNMTQANGLLSGLTVNGIQIDTRSDGPLGNGTLGTQFAIRDELSVEAQADLDATAMDLIQRFQDPAMDATIGATDPGLFTDNQGYFDPANLTGISNRIELHDSVSMTGAAETWRLRDGLHAATQGNAGDASLLNAYTVALEASRSVTSPGLGSSNMDATTLSASLLSRFAQDKVAADQALSFASSSFSEAEQLEMSQGVDSDYELQNLMLIEQAYAANAKMLSAVDEMMQELLRI